MTARTGKVILYIEDDHASQRLVKRVLQNRGYKVHLAAEGIQGIELARAKEPDLILMDINLPTMDGREITTRLRSLPSFSNVPIIALTANNSKGNRELALAAGCSGYLTKPIDVMTFPHNIEAFLQGEVEPLSVEEKNTHLELHAQNVVERLENKVRELEDANEKLRELDRLKGDFIIMVSHELRTPLTLVSGYTHLLEEQVSQGTDTIPTTTLTNIATGLNSGVGRMQEVVNEIISVARISSGTLDLALGPVRMVPVIAEVTKSLSSVLDRRQLNLHVGDLAKLPIVEGDGKRLQVAFEHILGNAIKYTPDKGNIYIVGRLVGDAINIIIRDTGIGIPIEEQRRIFEPFFALGSIEHHSSSKSAFQGGGLGLGLAIAKGIVEAHNGRIWVESEGRNPDLPPGSTFHILLPTQQPRQSLL